MENSKYKLILASTSPRRKELLGHLKIPFEIMTKNVVEESNAQNPKDFCMEIAFLKGEAVATELKEQGSLQDYFIISADTIVSLNDKIFGKPRDRAEAQMFLKELAGKTHSVYTAVAVIVLKDDIKTTFSFVDESLVTFDKISDELLKLYLDKCDSLDKAGAYGIQGPSLTFISKVEGSYSNVVGFPLSRFVQETAKFFNNEVLWSTYFQF